MPLCGREGRAFTLHEPQAHEGRAQGKTTLAQYNCAFSALSQGAQVKCSLICFQNCETKDHFSYQTPQFFANYSEIRIAPTHLNDATFVKTGTQILLDVLIKDRNLTPLAAVFVSELGFQEATRAHQDGVETRLQDKADPRDSFEVDKNLSQCPASALLASFHSMF